MAEERAMAEVLEMLEAEAPSAAEGGALPLAVRGPDIPVLREKLAVLVSAGKAKEAIGVQLAHEQVKRLTDKEVEKYFKRYKTYVGSKTAENLIDTIIFLATKVAGLFVNIKNVEAYQKELREDYIIDKELSNVAGNFALKFGRFLALANFGLITTKHIDFSRPEAGEHAQGKNVVEIPEQS